MFWLFSIFEKLFFLISNVSTRSSFPKPLTREEEQMYIKKYLEEKDDAARSILIERNLRLVAHIVKKYAVNNDTDDLISIGTIGLIKAIATFDPEKSTHLATYASRCIENEILMHIRSTKKQRTEISLHEPVGVDREGNEISLMDILGNDEGDICDNLDFKINKAKLYKEIKNCLSTREQLVLKLRYGLDKNATMTQREVAQILGISRSYVSRIEKKAIEHLEKQFRQEYGKKQL